MNNNIKSHQLIIIGKVQGVGFRYWFNKEAIALNLKGYVKNLNNENEVESIVQGQINNILHFETYIGLNNIPSLEGVVKNSIEGIICSILNNNPKTRPLLLTGYGNIATAVAAIKFGAIDYLPKPAEVDQIYEALTSLKDILPPPPENPMTADRVRWEHIHRVFIQCNRNVSETARRLKMHRRTLQRILSKHAPKE